MIAVFWDVTPCRLVDRYQRVRGNCGLHLQNTRVPLFYPEGGGNRFLWNIYQTTRRHSPEYFNLNFKRRGNFKALTLSMRSSVVACLNLCRGNVFILPLPSNDRLQLLHHSGFRPSYHNMLDSKLSRQRLWSILGFWVWRRTVWQKFTDVTEESITPIVRPCCLRFARCWLVLHWRWNQYVHVKCNFCHTAWRHALCSYVRGLSAFLSVLLQSQDFIFIHSSMALQPFVGPWPLFHFLILYSDGQGM
jgi:hypothetical protein